MSTLAEIEAAADTLPAQDQRSLLAWLQGRLTDASEPAKAAPESLTVFRQLQQEMRLTAETAKTWKAAVAEARR